MAIKPLKPSKAKRKDKDYRDLQRQAREWVLRWRQEVARRRGLEQSLGSVSWRQDPSLNLDGLEPLLRQQVLKLLESPSH